MKKLLIITIVTMLAFTLSACGNNNVKSNTIVDAELTDREKGILSTTSNQSFVFDFKIEREYKEVSVWIEKYEFGKLVDEKIGHLTTEVMNNGSIILTIIDLDVIENQTLFNIGINSNGGTGSVRTSDIVSTKGTAGRSIVWGNMSEEMDVTNEQMVLASIGYSWDEGSMVSFSSEFYRDIERRINELENHEVVYLLRSKFTK
ncbi:hypothetical protein BKP45_08690 [Anaerobacillus alkalidiazotrophicus]|uniref:Uncharacterized protein n=1 Tax=Anaerobacillus alkalidiazotrophicus TaxID=472963 RepID=A0A1S2M7I9_9BACI|nr:hypothetical protein [Anaerobacillus alkalidiazotrophicus]OIJ20709.1 hypothetical protein BKP45_08690 [Anaerobacillus alkalidiazotrophicus]